MRGGVLPMAVPEFQTFLLPTLEALSIDEEKSIQRVRAILQFDMILSEEDEAERTKGGAATKFNDRVSWALTYLFQAGLTARPKRATYLLTEEGAALLERKPSRIDRPLLRNYPKFREFEARKRKPKKKEEKTADQSPGSPPFSAEEAEPEVRIRRAHDELSDLLEQQILTRVREASPKFLSRTLLDLLKSMGYGVETEVTDGPGDGGIDGMIAQDALGLDKIFIQSKRYSAGSKVGPSDILQFAGALGAQGMNRGVFVTTADFTAAAEKTAQTGPNNIVLINGVRLVRLMVLHNVGVRAGPVYNVKRLDADYFDRAADVLPAELSADPQPVRGIPPLL